ncbi:MAG: TIGR02996 domain-containing protein [Gemmataceae bacterium]
MDQHGALLQALAEKPENVELRLIYADWLDENGEYDRAEFQRFWARYKLLRSRPASDSSSTVYLLQEKLYLPDEGGISEDIRSQYEAVEESLFSFWQRWRRHRLPSTSVLQCRWVNYSFSVLDNYIRIDTIGRAWEDCPAIREIPCEAANAGITKTTRPPSRHHYFRVDDHMVYFANSETYKVFDTQHIDVRLGPESNVPPAQDIFTYPLRLADGSLLIGSGNHRAIAVVPPGDYEVRVTLSDIFVRTEWDHLGQAYAEQGSNTANIVWEEEIIYRTQNDAGHWEQPKQNSDTEGVLFTVVLSPMTRGFRA